MLEGYREFQIQQESVDVNDFSRVIDAAMKTMWGEIIGTTTRLPTVSYEDTIPWNHLVPLVESNGEIIYGAKRYIQDAATVHLANQTHGLLALFRNHEQRVSGYLLDNDTNGIRTGVTIKIANGVGRIQFFSPTWAYPALWMENIDQDTLQNAQYYAQLLYDVPYALAQFKEPMPAPMPLPPLRRQVTLS